MKTCQKQPNGLLSVSFSTIYWQHDFFWVTDEVYTSSGSSFKALDELVFMAASNLMIGIR